MKTIELNPVEVANLYHKGLSSQEIATLLGCSKAPIYRSLRNPESNPQGLTKRRMDFDEVELVRLYQSGLTGRQALEAVGAPATRGWGVLRDLEKNPDGLRHEASIANRFKKRQGKFLMAEGYANCYIKSDHKFYEMVNSRSCVPEHRLVMAEHLGRPLRRNENVHHLNGIRDDNRIENLELWNKSQPSGIRNSDSHCLTCTCGKAT